MIVLTGFQVHTSLLNRYNLWTGAPPHETLHFCLNIQAVLACVVNSVKRLWMCAGATFGQELPPHEMQRLIRAAGRVPLHRYVVPLKSCPLMVKQDSNMAHKTSDKETHNTSDK